MNSICVYCGSSDGVPVEYLNAARRMGATIARRGLRLVFGGGRTGLMGAVADAALENGGQVIGVIVESLNTPALAHAGLTQLEVFPTMHQRKARIYELGDGFIALPGGYGTFDELFETLSNAQIGVHAKPVGILNVNGYFDPLLIMLDRAEAQGFIFPEHRQGLLSASDPDGLLETMEGYSPSAEAVQRWMRKT
jgi:uncharacterized protein (TIGR00730 family)